MPVVCADVIDLWGSQRRLLLWLPSVEGCMDGVHGEEEKEI